MQFLSGNCTQCGGKLQLPDDHKMIKCMYCGSEVIVLEATRTPTLDAESLLELGTKALESDNPDQAYDYFSRALEYHPKSVDAWIGKGTSAGWRSNLRSLRVIEMIECYKSAIEYCETIEAADATKLQCAANAYQIARAVFSTSLGHLVEFIGVPDANYGHIKRSRELVHALIIAREWAPELTEVSDFAIDICKRNLKSRYLVDSERTDFKSALKQLDPENKSAIGKNSACFVVTATMGQQDHPVVVTLRDFRAEILNQTAAGLRLSVFYNTHGPKLANFIRSSGARRLASFAFVVMPAYLLAVLLLGALRIYQQNRR